MRKACIKSYNKTYGLNLKLKDKKKGRNKDYTVSQMVHYDELVIEYDNHQKLIKDKLFGKKEEREKYMDVAEDLYSKKIIEEDTFEDLQDTYEFSKNHDYEREKDDFEIEI